MNTSIPADDEVPENHSIVASNVASGTQGSHSFNDETDFFLGKTFKNKHELISCGVEASCREEDL